MPGVWHKNFGVDMERGIRDGNIEGGVPPWSGKNIGGRFRPENNIVFADLKNIPAGNPASGVVR